MPIARIVDLRCQSCEHLLRDVYCKSGEEPCCPLCSGPMTVYWGTLYGKDLGKADNFQPLDYEGVHYNTREEWHAHISKMESNLGEKIEVHDHSRRAARARADEVRHAGWLERRRLGVDSKSAFEDYQHQHRRR